MKFRNIFAATAVFALLAFVTGCSKPAEEPAAATDAAPGNEGQGPCGERVWGKAHCAMSGGMCRVFAPWLQPLPPAWSSCH